MLWSAIVALVLTLMVAITWIVTTQSNSRTAQHDIDNLRQSVEDLQRQSDLLHKIDKQLAVVASQVDDIATEVDRQREWRDKIEGVAELPPHARRRPLK